jgi:hypothetical protein
MKKIFILVSCFVIQWCALSAMPRDRFLIQKDVAQYKGSDYANVVQVARQISLEEAFEIAENNPDIDYFVFTKGYMMVLEIPPHVPFDLSQDPFELVTHTPFIYDSGESSIGYCRIFREGDTLFFKKEGMWLGSAPDLADAYFKE